MKLLLSIALGAESGTQFSLTAVMGWTYRYTLSFLLLLQVGVALPSRNHPTVYKFWFVYQSQEISLSEWLEILTLCLAPLVTHIVFGLPEYVVLGTNNPKWVDKIAHFNPISIVWRYYAIADRRLRARRWDEADMAACNAVFWDGTRWDGSELVMVQSREWIIKLPPSSHVAFVSGSSLATIAITLQGMQAMLAIVTTFRPHVLRWDDPSHSLPSFFQPLALVGLLRLQAAFWLSSDYGYARIEHWQTPETEPGGDRTDTSLSGIVGARLTRSTSWRGVSFRIWWAVSVFVFAGGAIAACINSLFWVFLPPPDVVHITASHLAYTLMYFLLAVGCLVIHWMYLFKGCSGSTAIPCIQSP